MADIIGGRELADILARKAKSITDAADRALGDAAEAIRDDARRNVPVDTGKLRGGIKVRSAGPSRREIGISDPNLYYGRFIEHGTSSRRPRPFLLPAAERERRRLPQRVTDAITKELS